MLDREKIEAAAAVQWPGEGRVATDYKWGWVVYKKDCSEVHAVAEVDGKITFTRK